MTAELEPRDLDDLLTRALAVDLPAAARTRIRARLDARGPRRRSRTFGFAALGTVAAVTIALVVANTVLVRPTLAYAPTPVAADEATRAAAVAACAGEVVNSETVRFSSDGLADPTGVTVLPLVALEMHGNGGVAVFADADHVGACMLRQDGSALTSLDRSVYARDGQSSLTALTLGGGSVDGAMFVTAVGAAPAGTARVEVITDRADGAYATVADGLWGIWLPGATDLRGLVALDGAGRTLERVDIVGGRAVPGS